MTSAQLILATPASGVSPPMTLWVEGSNKSYRGVAIHNVTIPATTAAPPMRSER